MLRLVLFFLSLWVAALGAAPAQAETRVALVVGNSRYVNVRPLANPENDAGLIADTLRSLGFTLVGGRAQLDLDDVRFRRAVKDFGEQAQRADVALFYYAGHGVQLQSTNYLVPIDADLAKEADVDFMLDVNLVLRQMDGAQTKVKLVILDACRNNPFAGGRSLAVGRARDPEASRLRDVGGSRGGLAEMKAAKGMLIAFATQPGQTAQDGPDNGHSPYTQALADILRTPGLGLFDVFNEVGKQVAAQTKDAQQPWWSSSPIEHAFSFVGSAPVSAVPPRPASVPAPAVPSADEIARRYEAQARTAALGPNVSAADSKAEAAPVPVGQLSPARERALKPSEHFKECETCPEMIVVPPGAFMMGSPAGESGRESTEGPQQPITFAHSFAVGRSAVTFEEWNACVAEGGCNSYRPGDYGWGAGKRPVINVSWNDAQAFVKWLSQKTGARYRLLSEAEREYIARGCALPACPSTPFWFGADISPERANYDWRFSYNGSPKAQPPRRTVATDASQANPFGLLQVHGNVREWVEDCWNASLAGTPRDGGARSTGDCMSHVTRGGSWADEPKDLRSAKRTWETAGERRAQIGFRVARTLRD